MSRIAVLGAAAAIALGLSACGGDAEEQDPPAADEPEQEEPAEEGEDEADEAGPLAVEAGEMYFDGVPDTIEAGTVEFELENVGTMPHDIAIEEIGDVLVVEADPGETATGTVELEPGEYTIYCTVGNHREQGMEQTITVE